VVLTQLKFEVIKLNQDKMAGIPQKQLSLWDACHFLNIKPWILSMFSLSFLLSTNGWATLI
jgi:hypothetical protein